MLTKFGNWLNFTHYNEEDQRMAQILSGMLLIYWVSSLVVLALDVLWGDHSLLPFLLLGSALQTLSLLLLLRGKLYVSAYLSIILHIVIITAFATVGQGIHDYVVMVYPAVLMYAGLVLQRRGLMLATLLTTGSLVWLVFGEFFGWFTPRNIFIPQWTDLIAAEMLIMMSALAVYLLVSNLEYGITQTWRELAQRKRAEEALRESEKQLAEIFENSQDNIFVMDVAAGGRFTINKVNSALARVFHAEQRDLEGRFLDEVVDQHNLELITANFQKCIAEGASIQYEEFADLPDGVIHYSTHLHPIFGEDGNIARFIGVSRNITDRKQMETALRQSEQRFKSYVENAPNIITVIDTAARIKYLNRAEFGLPISMFLGKAILEVIAPDEQKTVKQALEITRATRQPCIYSTSAHIDGKVSWYDNHAALIDPSDPQSDIVIISTNVTERKQAEDERRRHGSLLQEANDELRARVYEIEQLHAELREQATRDSLTGLYNRRYMQDVFEREFSRAHREQHPLSIIMMDMDELKVINDTFGHHIGDAAIQTFAVCLKNMTRVEDVAFRYGGDEFTIALSKTSAEDAFRRVEEWREFLSNNPLVVDSTHKVQIKFTAGIACFPTHGNSAEEVVNYADIALYRAKARGRNRTLIFQ